MRIGTWNLQGRWSDRHRDLLLAQDCDVWLLTEVKEGVALDRYHRHATTELMLPGKRWAAVLSRSPLEPVKDPHPASAAAVIGATTYCSTILPWRGCEEYWPWQSGSHGEMFKATLDVLLENVPRSDLVWGGDWNQELKGRIWSGSSGAQGYLVEAVRRLGLKVPTENLLHPKGGSSIDHVAVPVAWKVADQCCVPASHDGKRLSDHDAYLIECETK